MKLFDVESTAAFTESKCTTSETGKAVMILWKEHQYPQGALFEMNKDEE